MFRRKHVLRRDRTAYRPGDSLGRTEPLEPRRLLTTLPSGFVEEVVADGLAFPSAMALAPDGRVFVAQSSGTVRIIKDDALVPEPFLTLPVSAEGERGLVGLTLDPMFPSTPYVYVYYTVPATESRPAFNRISRFEAEGDVARPGSERILLELDPLTPDRLVHNGGAMHFGPDGTLYIGVGDHGVPESAQRLDALTGKMLRLNPDGSIPSDNPFADALPAPYSAIWALGLRNPFTFAFDANSGRILINDVGLDTYEEINEGAPGANFGWPISEGPTDNPAFVNPIHAYRHEKPAGYGQACAITGGVFYDGHAIGFPEEYDGRYLFADFCGAWIKTLDPSTGQVADFASDTGGLPIDLDVDAAGNLYYLVWRGSGDGQVRRIQYAPETAPRIAPLPVTTTVPEGASATFTVSVSGSGPIDFQWQRDGVDIDGATGPTYVLPAVTPRDDGARFRVIATNAYGSTTSNESLLTVRAGRPPSAAIVAPSEGTSYHEGDVIAFQGVGQDPEDGPLDPSAFTWEVVFHHDAHTHPFLPPTSGIDRGTFTIPASSHDPGEYWYRIHLTVTDSSGLTASTFRDIRPASQHATMPEPGPVLGRLAPASERGGAGSNITDARRPQFVGTGPTRSFATLYAAEVGGTRILPMGRAWIGRQGTWRLASRPIPPGSYHVWATWGPLRGPQSQTPTPIWSLDATPLVVQAPPFRGFRR